jgi:epoxyqueuosine reductase QueG
MSLKNAVKQFAYEMGADLVGIGNIERCEHAPPMMSPQGLLPSARSIISMSIRHPDGCIEMGGETHPQETGPYAVQYLMNTRLDEMSYRMATFLERAGCQAVPIAASNIWRYTSYKELDAVFAPDLSHIYMAVVAGLADMGYHGIAMTPEYGARNRFVTVVTDAELEPDPLIEPGTVCDNCMLCRDNCPAEALSKEIDGDKVLSIEGREYRFANKNLWRCSWGEHFGLDLDLPKPEKVTEEVILETFEKYGARGGEMGQCLKFCVPENLRTWDREYSRTPMRRYAMTMDESAESRAVLDRILTSLHARGVEHVITADKALTEELGFDMDTCLPGAKSILLAAIELPPGTSLDDGSTVMQQATRHICDSAMYDCTRDLEDMGFRSVVYTWDRGDREFIAGLLAHVGLDGKSCQPCLIVTRKTLRTQVSTQMAPPLAVDAGQADDRPADALGRLAAQLGADLFGIASVDRVDALADQLRPHYAGQTRLAAHNRATRARPMDWEVQEEPIELRTAEDVLSGARSVIVLGMRLHKATVDRATKPPAEAVGPYAFETFTTQRMAARAGLRIMQALRASGHRASATSDLLGLSSIMASPREAMPDFTSSRFAAVAAGLGRLTRNGRVATPEFGLRQRFFCIVTDAELAPSGLADTSAPLLCDQCGDRCVAACPATAFAGDEITLKLEGRTFRFRPVDERRCDWSRRYALQAESGFGYLGSPLDVAPPESIDATALKAALDRHDPIRTNRTVVAEPCMLACPYAREQ